MYIHPAIIWYRLIAGVFFMSKILKSFRLSSETIEKLDFIVCFKNEELKRLGLTPLKVDRTAILETIINNTYDDLQKRKKS
jgi:hypothetical protein